MNLLDYIKGLDKEQTLVFAQRCVTSVGYLKQVAYGHRRASVVLAISLDRETGGVISCESLRPDIDWAYLGSRTGQAA